ncbi:PLP-dependent transferase [Piedraia hortae CBS 480.64]|uniref:PLP-dependent transferase n=1 Tax=Piedraia hortae CBS 480.64 TaxID=1314780 RepID=A0A6A7BXJ6_9PEZI|nr:PLP-dependent transferase [Piedraia hortae CBS 480.64]
MSKIGCGPSALSEFPLAKGYRNLNHGSFGTYPLSIQPILDKYRRDCEARPDLWIRWEYPKLLDRSREAIAAFVHAPVETCVLVPNATTGLNVVLRNLTYTKGDTVIYFPSIYGACEKTIMHLMETTPLSAHRLDSSLSVLDGDAICDSFRSAITTLRSRGQTPKVAVFDTISAIPGTRMPFERLTQICREASVLSCIDAAHSIGQIPLNLTQLDPDFFFTNCHKWLYTPRGCALLYVPVRNQHLIRTPFPTSHGFVPRVGQGINNPLPPTTKSEFVNNFEFVATLDNTPYLSIPAALEWRRRAVYKNLEGDEAIYTYLHTLAADSGRVVAEILGTEAMEQHPRSAFANVRLPLTSTASKAADVARGITDVVLREYDSFVLVYVYNGMLWVRLSAQMYLGIGDFEWVGKVLKGVCERVQRGSKL